MSHREYPRGTVTHIPPENWQNINIALSEKFDVYSFSILLWELLSDSQPFSTSKLAWCNRQISGSIPRGSAIVNDTVYKMLLLCQRNHLDAH